MKPEANVLSTFKPVYYAQILSGSAKVNLNKNEAMKLTIYQKIYSLIFLSFCSYSHYYIVRYKHCDEYARQTTIEHMLTAAQMLAGFMLNINIIIINNFFFGDNKMELFEQLLDIDRKLKIYGNNKCGAVYKFVLISTIFLMVFHGTFMITGILASTKLQDYLWISIGRSLLITEYIELVLMVAILFVLINKIKYINKIIHLSTLVKWRKEVIDHSEMMHRMWRAYEGVACVYKITEKIFSMFMLLLVIHSFFCILLSVELFILSHTNDVQVTLGQNSISVVFVARIILIGLTLNHLEIQVKKTEDICFCAIQKSNSIYTRRYAKNIVRVIRTNMEPMTVFGMFTISTVPLKFMSIIATYAIILLEFAYL